MNMLYFIAAGDPVQAIKIGFTESDESPDQRLAVLQTGNHLQLHVVAFGPGTRTDEAALHRLHAADRLQGEWFKVTATVLASAARLGLQDWTPGRTLGRRAELLILRAQRCAAVDAQYEGRKLTRAERGAWLRERRTALG